MSPPAENFYTDWRSCFGVGNVLRDENDPPPERLLQAIWRHQRLQRDRLQTADGRSVRVLHPGFVSVEGGPDFRGAVIQIGDAAPCSGDVEIDLRAGGWRAHGHDRNPDFKNVLLHVVWDDVGVRALACQRVPYTKEQSRSAGLNSNRCRQRWRSAINWMRPSLNSGCGLKMIHRESCPKIYAANVAWSCANWMNRGKAGF